MRLLRQSTAATLTVGPFVDGTDGFTPETGLAAGTVDEIGVYKAGGTALVDISGTTTFTHRAGGIYTLTLSTTDTETAGPLIVYVRDDNVCRPVLMEFMVLPANVYDSLVAGTDKLDASVVQWLGTAVTLSATTSKPEVDMASIHDDATAAANLESYTDGSGFMPVNVEQIDTSSTDAGKLSDILDGTDNLQVHLVEMTSTFDFTTTMKTSLETAVTNALNTAVPGSPTANSVFQRVKAIDELTEASGAGDLAALLTLAETDGVKIDLAQTLSESPTSLTVGYALYATLASVAHKQSFASGVKLIYKSNGSTVFLTLNADSATTPTTLTPA